MSALRGPLKGALRGVTTQASVARMWHHIDARLRVGKLRADSRRSSARKRSAWLAAVAVLLTIAVAAASIRYRDVVAARPSDRAAPSSRRLAPGPTRVRVPEVAVAAGLPAFASARAAAESKAEPLVLKPSIPPWKGLARRGQNAKAYADLGPGGVAQMANGASVEDLLVLADIARLSGHPREAVEPLERVINGHASDPRASLAAFTLGRVELDSLGAPAAGAKAFEQAIAMGIPGGLAEDAYAGVVEARARAGDSAGAERASAEYLRKYPQGRRANEVKHWVLEP